MSKRYEVSDRRKPLRAKRRPGTGRARAKTEKATYAIQAGPPDRRAESLHLIIESAPNAIVVANAEGAIVFANSQTGKFFGYDREELIGLPIEELVPERIRSRHERYRLDFGADPVMRPMGIGRDLFGLRKDGSEFPVEIGLNPVRTDEGLLVLATMVDISERKRAQDDLRASEERYRSLFDHAPVCIHEIGLDGCLLAMNTAGLRMLGVQDQRGVIGVRYLDAASEEDRPRVEALLGRAFLGHSSEFEFTAQSREGRRIFASSFIPIRSADGSIQKVMGVTQDISERKQAEDALRETQRALSTLIGNLPGVAYRCRNDHDWTMEYASDGIFELTGYRPADFSERRTVSLGQLVHPEDRERIWNEVQAAVQSRRRYQVVYRLRTGAGEEKWVWQQGQGVFDPDGQLRALEGFITDITDRRRTEELLREQATLARLGQMAAVVAHEVKNPLAGIRGALQVIAGNLPAEGRERAVIGDIQARIDSLNEMVEDLLTFARPRAPNFVFASVRSMLEGTAALLRQDPQWGQVEVQVTGDNPTIPADAEQLHIVFFNLLLNAAQAMQGQGRVEVTVSSANERCEIAVRDTGPGIPPDVRQRMFEPFFTTKNRGTGLGLATAKAIVERHHGELRADCLPGGGTVMVVSLPIGRSPSPTA